MSPEETALGNRAVEQGLLTASQLEEAVRSLGQNGSQASSDLSPLRAALLKGNYLSEDQISALEREMAPSGTAPAVPAPRTLSPTPSEGPGEGPQTFGKFMLVNALGSHGNVTLFRAWQKNLRRWVSLRILLKPDPGTRAAFIQGAQLAAMLEHSGILRIFEVGVHADYPFVAAEFLKGRPLDKAVDPTRRQIVDWIIETGNALHYAHERKVVHGNLRPSNILLVESGDRIGAERVVITDFALPPKASPYTCLSSAELPAPGIQNDLHGLGAVLHRMLVGTPPLRKADGTLQGPKEIRQDVPRELDGIVRRALARESEPGFSTTADFVAALKTHLRRSSVASNIARRSSKIAPAQIPSPQEEPQPPPRRRLLRIVVVAGLILALGGTLVWYLWGRTLKGGKENHPSSSPPPVAPDSALNRAGNAWKKYQERRSDPATRSGSVGELLESGLQAAQEAMTGNASPPAAHLYRGRFLSAQGRLRDSVDAYAHVLQIESRHQEALTERADVLLRLLFRQSEADRLSETQRRLLTPSPLGPLPNLCRMNPSSGSLASRAEADLQMLLAIPDLPEREVARIRFDQSWLSGDYPKCRQSIDSLLLAHPGQEDYLIRRARLRMVQALDGLDTLQPAGRGSAINAGLNHALSDLQQITTSAPNDYGTLLEMGALLMMLGSPDKAIERFQRAKDLAPTLPEALLNCGISGLELPARRAASITCLEEYRGKDPSNLEVLFALLIGSFLADDRERVLKYGDEIRKSNSRDPRIPYFLLATDSHLTREPGDLEPLLLKAAQDPQVLTIFLDLAGMLAEHRNDLQAAAGYYDRALAIPGCPFQVRASRAWIFGLENKWKPAREAIVGDPGSAAGMEDLSMAGSMHLLCRDLGNAEKYLRLATRFPNAPVYATANLAVLLDMSDRAAEAEPMHAQAYDRAKSNLVMMTGNDADLKKFWYAIGVNYARNLLAQGKSGKALEVAQQAVLWNEPSPYARTVLAEALEAADRRDEAGRERVKAGEIPPFQALIMIARILKIDFPFAVPCAGLGPGPMVRRKILRVERDVKVAPASP